VGFTPKRVLLKLSGEALMGEGPPPPGGKASIDGATLERIASEVKEVVGLGVETAVVIGDDPPAVGRGGRGMRC